MLLNIESEVRIETKSLVDAEMKCVRANSLAYANPTDNNSGQASVKSQL